MKRGRRKKANQHEKKWIRKLARLISRRDSSALLQGSTANRECEPNTETANRNLSKTERIRMLFYSNAQPLSKRNILDKCPDIGISSVEAILSRLLKEGLIQKINAGKKTAYVRNLDLD